ncbi:unnamed protein product, partial [Brassica oleracea]
VWLRISGESERENGYEAPLWWFRGGGGLDLGLDLDLDFCGGFSLFFCLLVLSSRFGGCRCHCFKPVDRSLEGSSELPSVLVRLVRCGFSVAGARARRPVVGLVNHGCSFRRQHMRDCKYQGLDLGLPPSHFDSRRSLFSLST